MRLHLNNEVQQALNRLNDALCLWERATGIRSVLILREDSGWVHRSCNGKPLAGNQDDIPDGPLLEQLQ